MDRIWLDERAALEFATPERGREVLTRRDDFVACMSAFDRSVRLMTARPVSEAELLAHIAAQVQAWQPGEMARVRAAMAPALDGLAHYAAWLPERVWLVRTSGQEEAHAAYTRGNAVVLPAGKLSAELPVLSELITHELFHVLSRHNPDRRDALYACIGYRPCGDVAWPAGMEERRITNPDAPRSAHYIEVGYDHATLPAIPILYANAPAYDPGRGGEIFDYVTFRLLAIERAGAGWQPRRRHDAALCLEVGQVGGFFEQIGRNTDYIIHPEETLAANFVFLALDRHDVPSPWVLARMAQALAG